MTLSFILLGLLIDRPMTGYDLKTFFNSSINFFWSAELSQIYRELSRLEKQGYLNSKVEQQEGRPNKKLYYITEAGKKAFLGWLEKFPERLGSESKNEFLVRLFFSSRLPDEDLVFHFRKYIKDMENELGIYRIIEERLNSRIAKDIGCREAFHQRLTVRRGIHYAQSEISWARECIEEITRLISRNK